MIITIISYANKAQFTCFRPIVIVSLKDKPHRSTRVPRSSYLSTSIVSLECNDLGTPVERYR